MSGTQFNAQEQNSRSSNGSGLPGSEKPVGLGALDEIRSSFVAVRALLESADHAIGEYIQVQKMTSVENLAGELGHDLRNGIMALAGKVLRLERAFPNDEMRENAEEMRGILKNLEEMVSRLQSLGIDECSQGSFGPLDLSLEVDKTIRFMGSSLGDCVQLQIEASPDPLPVVLCNGDVWRILSNLLLNARDAMPDGGKLQLRVFGRHIDDVYCRNHGNAFRGYFAVLSVKDEGSGIAPETLSRIFDPLFSTKPSSLDGQKRGWGLAIVYMLVKRRGGWIDVESQPGEGARFEVFLPICR